MASSKFDNLNKLSATLLNEGHPDPVDRLVLENSACNIFGRPVIIHFLANGHRKWPVIWPSNGSLTLPITLPLATSSACHET